MSVKGFLAVGLALHNPSQASACRVGWDQHLFAVYPKPKGLAGAQIIHVKFSTAKPLLQKWPKSASGPDGQIDYTLIGVARLLNEAGVGEQHFPVYGFLTSCSGFWGLLSDGARPVVEGNYYLVGRFEGYGSSRRFRAGGVRMNIGGEPVYQGWHF